MIETQIQEPSALLSAHTGKTHTITRQALAAIATPPRTPSFCPVPHGQFLDTIEHALGGYRMDIRRQEFAVSDDGLKLFGVLILKHQTQEGMSFALGLRTANDRTMAAQIVVGVNVFVCDNMALSGEPITWRKHTSQLDIRAEIQDGIGKAVGRFEAMDAQVTRLRGEHISDDRAKAMMLDAALKGVMPLRMLPHVAESYFTPPHAEFAERNLWSLHNAFTEAFKGLRPNVAMESTVELGKVFGM